MSKKANYLNLIVLLTFLVGQVQYAYSSRFCTMMQQPMKPHTMSMSPAATAASDVCDQCQMAVPAQQGPRLVEGDCMKVTSSHKSIVDNFTDTQKSVQHFVSAAFISNSLSTVATQLLPATYRLLPTAVSPPSDLPTLNSNLRI